MFNKSKLLISIQAFISILILMTLFVASAHATSCHEPEQDTTQYNPKLIKAHDISSANVIVEASVAQSKSNQCCMGICNVICNMHSTPNDLLLISHSFENKRLIDVSTTKYYLDSELEDTRKNIKLNDYYQSSHTTTPSILQTTLKHRVLHI
tara:strand:+ start:3650 stop:4105 length:456 start_codon:yes stop_codon:yes gene_type:complete